MATQNLGGTIVCPTTGVYGEIPAPYPGSQFESTGGGEGGPQVGGDNPEVAVNMEGGMVTHRPMR